MTIAEIESTLHTLLTRHPNLDEGMLVTLLTSASWEDKNIQDAVVLFKTKYPQQAVSSQKQSPKVVDSSPQKNVNTQKTIENNGFSAVPTTPPAVLTPPPIIIPPVISQNSITTAQSASSPVPIENIVEKSKSTETTDLVYYDTEGKEEEVLPVYVDDGKELPKVKEPLVIFSKTENTPVVQVVNPPEVVPVVIEKEIPKVIEQKIVEQKEDIQISKMVTEEPQSLIEQKVVVRAQAQPIELPDNLPLKPFESAPHVWPFSKYKEVFHGTGVPILSSKEEDLVTKEKESQIYVKNVEEKQIVKKVKIKRTGFDGEDEGLIFLTGITLLIILLLLAYMYSNGRF